MAVTVRPDRRGGVARVWEIAEARRSIAGLWLARGLLYAGGMRVALVAVWVAATVAACGGGGGEDPDAAGPPPDAYVDLAGPLFAPDHIVDVSITLAPD